MAGTYAYVKVKVMTDGNQYEREGSTDWDTPKNRLPNAYRLISETISEIIGIITQRCPHHGLHVSASIQTLTSISWTIINGLTGKLIKSGRYTELNEGDPPVAFMTPLTPEVDAALDKYHTARKHNEQPTLFPVE